MNVSPASQLLKVPTVITVTHPAVGTFWVHTVPTGRLWRLLWGRFRYLADANVANRGLEVQILEAGDDHFKTGTNTNITAGQNNTIYLTPGGGIMGIVQTQSNVRFMPMPGLVTLQAGWQLLGIAINQQVGDAFSEIRLVVEEYIL